MVEVAEVLKVMSLGESGEKVTAPPSKVEVPVFTVKALAPMTLVLPFRYTVPVPVSNVPVPIW